MRRWLPGALIVVAVAGCAEVRVDGSGGDRLDSLTASGSPINKDRVAEVRSASAQEAVMACMQSTGDFVFEMDCADRLTSAGDRMGAKAHLARALHVAPDRQHACYAVMPVLDGSHADEIGADRGLVEECRAQRAQLIALANDEHLRFPDPQACHQQCQTDLDTCIQNTGAALACSRVWAVSCSNSCGAVR
jgi:hypothetical protein